MVFFFSILVLLYSTDKKKKKDEYRAAVDEGWGGKGEDGGVPQRPPASPQNGFSPCLLSPLKFLPLVCLTLHWQCDESLKSCLISNSYLLKSVV